MRMHYVFDKGRYSNWPNGIDLLKRVGWYWHLIMKFFLISESSHLGITKSCARLRRLCVWVLTGGSSWCMYMVIIMYAGAFQRLLPAFARWQPDILFDTGVQPILGCHWIVSYTQPSLQTQIEAKPNCICSEMGRAPFYISISQMGRVIFDPWYQLRIFSLF